MSAVQPVVHIVDDDRSCRAAMARLLTAAGYDVRTYGSAGDFVLARQGLDHGCLLLDLRLPGPSGLDLQDFLGKQEERLPVIFVSGHGDVATSVRAMKAGAVDFLTKPAKREVLLNAVRNALARDAERRQLNEELRRHKLCYETLTAREREVFDGVVAGKPNKQIAIELGTSERTIKAHRSSVMSKMQAGSVPELVRVAEQLRRSALSCP